MGECVTQWWTREWEGGRKWVAVVEGRGQVGICGMKWTE